MHATPGSTVDLLGLLLPQQSQMAEQGERAMFAS